MRGVFSGALKKKLGLVVVGTKEERGRVYRIAAAGARCRSTSTERLASKRVVLPAKRQLRSLSETSDQRDGAITLKPGAKLVREWHEEVHTVNVLDDGFEYQGERYPSLTRIARRITGAQ